MDKEQATQDLARAVEVMNMQKWGFEPIKHSGQIRDADIRWKHISTEMTEPGYYWINISEVVIFGPFKSASITDEVRNAFAAYQLKRVVEVLDAQIVD